MKSKSSLGVDEKWLEKMKDFSESEPTSSESETETEDKPSPVNPPVYSDDEDVLISKLAKFGKSVK